YEARELWEPSPSPVEDWGSADGVDFSMEIVGEEVRYDGESRCVNWGGWKRPNGTSTTWEGPDTTSTHLPTTMWENQRTRTPAFELWGTSDIHNALTRERQQGHEETTKEELAAEQAECDKLMQRMHNSLAKHRIPFPAKKAHRTEARTSSTAVTVVPLPLPRRSQINAQASSSRIHVNAEAGPSRTRQSPCPPSPPRVHAMPPTTTASFSRLPPAAPSIPLFPPRVSLPRRPSPAPRLSRHTSPAISISSSSTESIEFLNSNPTLPTAGISFVNDVDDEEVPPSLYGEGWEFDDSVTPLVADPSFFIPCDCPKTCKGKLCGCQDEVIEYAYTDGLFNFKYLPNQLVVECNPYCNCAEDCDNRVTQRARKFKIEVFKTERCGWGVRAAVDVEKGKVLGVYTGSAFSPHDQAEQLTGAAKEYCFDLDYNEGEDTDRAYLYSVDSLKCVRYLACLPYPSTNSILCSHSCQPNLRVQPVVYDTLPSQNAAFLAFIATDFITAQTEFTFDYDPEAWGARRPSDAQDCMCRAERCRGWVRTE
ncbi:hypothetical protein C8R43DRAFT_871409, partial [Mycena crocata]